MQNEPERWAKNNLPETRTNEKLKMRDLNYELMQLRCRNRVHTADVLESLGR